MIKSFVVLIAILVATIISKVQNTVESIDKFSKAIYQNEQVNAVCSMLKTGKAVYEKYIDHQ